MGVTVYIVSSVETTGRHLENIHLNSYITLDTKVSSRWIKDLNVINETVNVLREVTDDACHSLEVEQALLGKAPSRSHEETHRKESHTFHSRMKRSI